MIRLTSQVIRAIHKYKADFPVLFAEYEQHKQVMKDKNKETRTKFYSVSNSWLSLSDLANQEYLLLIEQYLRVKKVPCNNRELLITTHNGGQHIGFFEEDKWWYNPAKGNKIEEKGIVIKWEKNYF